MSTEIRGYHQSPPLNFGGSKIGTDGLKPTSISVGNSSETRPRTYPSQAVLHSPAPTSVSDHGPTLLDVEEGSPFSNVASIETKPTKRRVSTKTDLNAVAKKANFLKKLGHLSGEGQRGVMSLIQAIKDGQAMLRNGLSKEEVHSHFDWIQAGIERAQFTPEAQRGVVEKLQMAIREIME